MSLVKGRRMRGDLQDYANHVYIAGHLDERHFDALNSSGDVTFLYRHGALDALDEIPAGSMRSIEGGWYDRTLIEREFSLAEVQERDAWIDSIFAEDSVTESIELQD